MARNVVGGKGRFANSLYMAKKEWQPPTEQIEGDEGNGVSFELELAKRAGISWGSDLSFSWVYVLDLEPTGEAALSGMVQKGDLSLIHI